MDLHKMRIKQKIREDEIGDQKDMEYHIFGTDEMQKKGRTR